MQYEVNISRVIIVLSVDIFLWCARRPLEQTGPVPRRRPASRWRQGRQEDDIIVRGLVIEGRRPPATEPSPAGLGRRRRRQGGRGGGRLASAEGVGSHDQAEGAPVQSHEEEPAGQPALAAD